MINVLKSATKIAAGAALLVGGFVSVPAHAVLIDGIEFGPGNTFITQTIFESGTGAGGVVSAAGDKIYGVGIVTNIQSPTGNIVWTSGTNGRELTIYFHDFTAEKIIGGPPPFFIPFSGGIATMYSQVFGTFDAFAGNEAAVIASATAGTEWLDLKGKTTGVACGDGSFYGGAPGSCFNADGTPITLQSSIFAGSLASITSGSGNGNLDVDTSGIGDANFYFNTNQCPPGGPGTCPTGTDYDISLNSSFNQEPDGPPTGSPFSVTGSLDLKSTVRVPEPTTMALLGAGFLGMGALSRRRRMVA